MQLMLPVNETNSVIVLDITGEEKISKPPKKMQKLEPISSTNKKKK